MLRKRLRYRQQTVRLHIKIGRQLASRGCTVCCTEHEIAAAYITSA